MVEPFLFIFRVLGFREKIKNAPLLTTLKWRRERERDTDTQTQTQTQAQTQTQTQAQA